MERDVAIEKGSRVAAVNRSCPTPASKESAADLTYQRRWFPPPATPRARIPCVGLSDLSCERTPADSCRRLNVISQCFTPRQRQQETDQTDQAGLGKRVRSNDWSRDYEFVTGAPISAAKSASPRSLRAAAPRPRHRQEVDVLGFAIRLAVDSDVECGHSRDVVARYQ
jgi:hypothetical protein